MVNVHVSSSRSMLETPSIRRAAEMLAPWLPIARPISSWRTLNWVWCCSSDELDCNRVSCGRYTPNKQLVIIWNMDRIMVHVAEAAAARKHVKYVVVATSDAFNTSPCGIEGSSGPWGQWISYWFGTVPVVDHGRHPWNVLLISARVRSHPAL